MAAPHQSSRAMSASLSLLQKGYNKQPDQMLEPVSGRAGKSIWTYMWIPASITKHHKLWKFNYIFKGTFLIPSLLAKVT